MDSSLATSIVPRADGSLAVGITLHRQGGPAERWWLGGYRTRERARHAESMVFEFLEGVLRRQGALGERDLDDAYWLVERQPTVVIDGSPATLWYAH